MSNIIQKIFGSFDFSGTAEQLKARLEKLEIPLDYSSALIDYMMERSYLEGMSARCNEDIRAVSSKGQSAIGWIRVDRLPIHPSMEKEYDIMSRWQSVLSAIHAWGHRVVFMLRRSNGETRLFIGVGGAANIAEGMAHLKSALINCMPGIEVESLSFDECMQLSDSMSTYNVGGAVTGIPSLRSDVQTQMLQTLDRLAFGVRDVNNEDANFSLVVVADPLKDADISEVIHRYQKVGSDIHADVTAHVTEGETLTQGSSSTSGGSLNFGIGQILSSAVQMGAVNLLGASVGTLATLLGTSVGLSHFRGKSRSASVSRSVTKDYLNKFAQYTEQQTDMHCDRLRRGRNLGFWNVGSYVLGYMDRDVNTVLGMLRSIYSGDTTYLEPIRIHPLSQPRALEHIKNFSLIPLLMPSAENKDEWHMLGPAYQYLSTPMNTEELSLATSLPRKDVPGLRFVKTSVRFANNPGLGSGTDLLQLGHVVDSGIVQKNTYNMDIHSLVRHSLIVGSTGCGKTTTCKAIINEVLHRDVPVLVIEPAKDEYVRWAIEQNKHLPPEKQVNIYMPGVKSLDVFGVNEGMRALPQLRLNPFQPAAIDGAPVDLQTRCEQVTALVNASLPTSDILPVLIDEAFYTYLSQEIGPDFQQGDMPPRTDYPKLEGVLPVAQKLLKGRGYSQEVANGLAAALETRFNYLTRGKRGEVLNVRSSTSYARLFDRTTVVNLSKIANAKDKALIMSLLMLSLFEYRVSAYTYDEAYRKRAQANQLLHLTVVEEAHNVLARPAADLAATGNPQQVVADLFGNMLSEIRSQGEGLMIVDQVPTRLIDDVVRNTNFKIAHRLVARDDCEVMAAALGLRPDQQDIIPLLSRGQVLVASDCDDAASWVKINKPNILL